MATIFSHALVVVTAGSIARLDTRVIGWGALLAILPDVDVIGLPFGVAHYDWFGHRGFTHSLVFAGAATAAVMFFAIREIRANTRAWWAVFMFLLASAASHGLFDAMTNGGAGIAFFSPFSNTRYFLPWRPLEVSPIGRDFFSAGGIDTLLSEAQWLWLPCAVAWIAVAAVRRHSKLPPHDHHIRR